MYLLIVIIPFLNFLFLLNYGICLGTKYSKYLVVIGIIIGFLISIQIFFEVSLSGQVCYIVLGDWITSDMFFVNIGFLFDTITSVMLIIVFFISLLVHVYSLGYMENDAHLIRFLSYLSLFTFFMCILITANNFLQMFFGWEGVGLASYLLINFWFTRVIANVAALKAMIVNRIGDCGLLLGILCIFVTFYSLEYTVVFSLVYKVMDYKLLFLDLELNVIMLICLLLFIGIIGKSAQLGLHTWLPDAMEGPTPVSALIHAATMVTAGVFVLIRCSPFFELSESILGIITSIGALTSLLGALVAFGQEDIKKIIAYSTTSQLGYMVVSCGLSQYNFALFHLANHAIFKAFLFLSAGAIIHALMDEQNLNRMGKLALIFPLLYVFIFIGSCSLVGLPFLTGFYSKHIIMELSFSYYLINGFFICIVLYVAAFFTNMYSLKLIFKAFFLSNLSYKYYFKDIYHVSYYILIVLFLLGIGSIYIGYFINDGFIGFSSFFFGNSIYIFENHLLNLELDYESYYFKFLPVFFNLVAILLIFFYYFTFWKKLRFYYIWFFFNKAFFFNFFYNNYFVQFLLSFGYIVVKFFDRGFLQVIGSKGLSIFILNLSYFFLQMITGFILHYSIFLTLGLLFFIGFFFFYEYIFFILCIFLFFFVCLLYVSIYIYIAYILKEFIFKLTLKKRKSNWGIK